MLKISRKLSEEEINQIIDVVDPTNDFLNTIVEKFGEKKGEEVIDVLQGYADIYIRETLHPTAESPLRLTQADADASDAIRSIKRNCNARDIIAALRRDLDENDLPEALKSMGIDFDPISVAERVMRKNPPGRSRITPEQLQRLFTDDLCIPLITKKLYALKHQDELGDLLKSYVTALVAAQTEGAASSEALIRAHANAVNFISELTGDMGYAIEEMAIFYGNISRALAVANGKAHGTARTGRA